MLLSKEVISKWNSKNKKYYIGKGYKFTNYGEEFKVKIEDLTPSSKSIVRVKCDFCGKEIEKRYQDYIKQHHDVFGDCCAICQPKKNKLVCLEKYGVDNGAKTQQSKDKAKQSCREKYGCDNPMFSEEIKNNIRNYFINKYGVENPLLSSEVQDKIKATCVKRYGVENPFSSLEIQNKIAQTNIIKYGNKSASTNEKVKEKVKNTNNKKYGVDYYSQTEEYKNRVKNTCLEKYGYESVLRSPEIRSKITNTLLANGKCPTSQQQLEIFKILSEKYQNAILNYPCGKCNLDIALNINGVNIDVEYDGRYWHQDKQRDRKRDEFVKSQGYKVLRIKGNRKIPSKEKLYSLIEEVLNSDKSFYEYNMV